MKQLRLIKTIVFIFTFLLIFGTLIMLSKLYQQAVSKNEIAASKVRLALPDKASVKQISADNGLLYILTKKQKHSHIIIYNPEKEKIISTIILN